VIPIQQERIETPRLGLVPLDQEKARTLLAGDLSGIDHADGWPHGDTRDALRMATKAESPWPVWLVLADGVVTGDCGTAGEIDENGEVDIGLGFAAEVRGRGYGTETIRALSDWLMRQPGVERVVAREILADNIASRRALEKAGFAVQSSGEGVVSYTFRLGKRVDRA
jgi:RimJ/RimL family protein N-acetyltransferase